MSHVLRVMFMGIYVICGCVSVGRVGMAVGSLRYFEGGINSNTMQTCLQRYNVWSQCLHCDYCVLPNVPLIPSLPLEPSRGFCAFV